MEVNTFPTQDVVRAIGLKFAGSPGQAEAEDLSIRRTTACFHAWGIVDDAQHAL